MKSHGLFVAAALSLAVFVGCSKKEEAETSEAPAESTEAAGQETAAAAPSAPAATAATETLPGENNIRAALERKDYETAVGALLALRPMIPREAMADYQTLYGEVIDTLRAESGTDPKAAQALLKLNASSRGR